MIAAGIAVVAFQFKELLDGISWFFKEKTRGSELDRRLNAFGARPQLNQEELDSESLYRLNDTTTNRPRTVEAMNAELATLNRNAIGTRANSLRPSTLNQTDETRGLEQRLPPNFFNDLARAAPEASLQEITNAILNDNGIGAGANRMSFGALGPVGSTLRQATARLMRTAMPRPVSETSDARDARQLQNDIAVLQANGGVIPAPAGTPSPTTPGALNWGNGLPQPSAVPGATVTNALNPGWGWTGGNNIGAGPGGAHLPVVGMPGMPMPGVPFANQIRPNGVNFGPPPVAPGSTTTPPGAPGAPGTPAPDAATMRNVNDIERMIWGIQPGLDQFAAHRIAGETYREYRRAVPGTGINEDPAKLREILMRRLAANTQGTIAAAMMGLGMPGAASIPGTEGTSEFVGPPSPGATATGSGTTSTSTAGGGTLENTQLMSQMRSVELTGPLATANESLHYIGMNTRDTADSTEQVRAAIERLIGVLRPLSPGSPAAPVTTASNGPAIYYDTGLTNPMHA